MVASSQEEGVEMRTLKRIGRIFLGLFAIGVLVISCYRLGEDLAEVLPPWCVIFIVGCAVLVLVAVICIIFALGIIKITEIFKE